ncbi:PfkB family carbohydrate kinase [Streptomyces shaanxiensis]
MNLGGLVRRDRIRHVLDRIGSGDGFAAGLIHGLLAGHSLSRALRSISCAAERSLTPPSRSPNSASAPR